ncbi:3-oxoacyl-ACP reductase [Acinetobacter schindleri]|jgi:3-oxoacyl-[acyl-carrier protein] reductase|uniref:3-oxoacyl-ACP reductase n=1 Tax=Acinetobacter TaxID=469 RepID=UPI000661FE32|nr:MULTISPECIES: 3-oxoacyl-ACP reductase [Acinetobacter]APX63074.1 3-oxoacyl-(acyl-carrier-protein) reductase protein [Acinetobacter schindleri]KMV00583.1 3-ketoacyl-ACP reductase [Acinetobacter sp. VT 511]MBB4834708.1 3-oxoacyl-[acyl-carrier protein] reductase [Acinetobacter schindleri]PUR02244.1 3-oxoacyl-ACP reductase [Acinetobacter schindleri]WBX39202.1 3-oxoacyl-ACP reductase [Acinetobacter schindleri]
MTDQYQAFAKSPIGKFVIKNLGLPSPTFLERYDSATPVVKGAVLVGAAPGSTLTGSIAQVLANIHANSYAGNNAELQQAAAQAGLNLGAFNQGDKESKFKVAIFDASGIQNSDDLKALYDFFNPIARQIQASGRVVIVGTTPESATSVKQAIAQRALEGFVKSVGKEFKKGIAANLIYVDNGAEANLESALRFAISPRSAYVSGQVIRVSQAATQDVDWTKPLAGKTAVVTGASRGIGEAIAHVLARDGAHVICLDVPQQQADLDRVAGEIGGSTLAIDITAADAGEKIKVAAAAQGGLDIIVHNAGITRDKTLANMKPELWDLVININLSAIERVNDYLLNNHGLNANGRIICVSSISGIAGNLGQTNYAASKAGVVGIVKYTAPTLSNGITINAVAPGFIETQMTAAIPFAIREAGRRMNSMSQGGLPVDVAETIAMFASTASTGLNGNVVRVCGQSLLGA